tara:strand:+ start:10976 stop:11095 length:120 start_codon:yes stop_codon:yes gene_type:complete
MALIVGQEGYGETSVAAVKLGSTTVTKVYLGTTLVYTTS